MDGDGAGGASRLLTQDDQPVRSGIRQGAEQDGIDEGEDRRVRANAEREGQYGDACESRALPKPPDARI